jgi:hypothetical protein
MMKYLCDLPVYRISEKGYYRRRDIEISKRVEMCMRRLDPSEEMLRRNREWREQRFYEKYGPWSFNEIIGYLKLHFLGSQIRGEFFSAEKSRVGLTRKKLFTWQTFKLAPEEQLWGEETNEEIIKAIRTYIAACKKELRKGRVIDTHNFDALADYVDWRSFLGWADDRNTEEQRAQ